MLHRLYKPSLALLTDLYQITMAYGYWKAEPRRRVAEQLSAFHPGVKRLLNPHQYPVSLEAGLHARKMEIVRRIRAVVKPRATV